MNYPNASVVKLRNPIIMAASTKPVRDRALENLIASVVARDEFDSQAILGKESFESGRFETAEAYLIAITPLFRESGKGAIRRSAESTAASSAQFKGFVGALRSHYKKLGFESVTSNQITEKLLENIICPEARSAFKIGVVEGETKLKRDKVRDFYLSSLAHVVRKIEDSCKSFESVGIALPPGTGLYRLARALDCCVIGYEDEDLQKVKEKLDQRLSRILVIHDPLAIKPSIMKYCSEEAKKHNWILVVQSQKIYDFEKHLDSYPSLGVYHKPFACNNILFREQIGWEDKTFLSESDLYSAI